MARFRVATIPMGAELQPVEEKSFLNSAVSCLRQMGVDLIIPASNNSIFRCYPDGAIAAPYGTLIVDLRLSEETLWSNIHRNNRTAIRNAMKKGVQIRSGMEFADDAFTQVRDTFKRSKQPFMSLKAFRRLVSSAGDKVKVFSAEYQGVMQGCTVNFYSNYSAYSYYAGSIPNPVDGATKLLHWEAIRLFRNLGVSRYDFVGSRINPEKGSKQEKLMLYKRHLGGQLEQGYLWKYSFRSLKFAVYSWAVRLLRGGDVVDQEHHKLTP